LQAGNPKATGIRLAAFFQTEKEISMDVSKSEAERLLKFLNETFEEGKQFVIEQAPSVLRELVVWKRTEHTVLAVLSLLASLVCVYVLWRCCRWTMTRQKDFWNDDSVPNVLSAIGHMVGIIGGFIGSIAFLHGMIPQAKASFQVWMAPRIYLIEYLTSLLE